MAGHIPEDKITEIRQAVDIVDVIAESVLLKKSGKNFSGLCPFHSEKTPSFTVSPDKQIFHCFGCGAGGNVFSFVMKRDGVGFADAVRNLAARAGVAIPERPLSSRAVRQSSEQSTLFELNRLAADYFRQTLLHQSAGKPALDYLARRGLTRQSIEQFELGYAPKGWDHLLGYMARKKFSAGVLEKAGLVIPRRGGGGHYDRFRDRIIFPIHDEVARVVGFGGRVMDDSTPKYLNSPETLVYTKRRVLYGLNRAKDACRSAGSVFIVEGYLDLIALHQHGIPHAVATLGTALTAEQIRLLTRYAGRMVLVYDSDEAGIRSARRCIDLFWKEHVDFRRDDVFREERADTRILVLPEGHDPDSFLNAQGVDAFRRLAQSAPGVITFVMNQAVLHHGLSTEGKIRVVAELQPYLAAINDTVARALYVKQLAERIRLEESVILDRLKTHAAPMTAPGPGVPVSGASVSQPVAADERFEQRIIAMMLQFPEILPEIVKNGITDFFLYAHLKSAGETILRHRLRSPDQLPELLARIEEGTLKQTLVALAMSDENWTRKGCRAFLRRFVESRQKQVDGRSMQAAIEAAEREHNEAEVMRLLSEKQKLAVRREKQKMSALREK
ncbi:MAG: DNA primase [Desulfobacterales bacterium]|nr:DNA primase [Desulfobacterales bacterium]